MRLVLIRIGLVLAMFVFIDPIFSHEAHKKKDVKKATTQPYTTQTRIASEPILEPEAAAPTRDLQTIMRGSAMAHFHNKIIHFPLALGITASILIFFAGRRPEMIPSIRVLLIIAAIFAVAAYFTGKSQEEPFEEGEMAEVVEWHERMGIASGILLWIGIIGISSNRARKWLPIYAVIQLAVLSGAGFLGGVLAHG